MVFRSEEGEGNKWASGSEEKKKVEGKMLLFVRKKNSFDELDESL